MKHLIFIGFVVMTLLSCNVNDIYHAVDNYDFMVRFADLARAVINDDFDVDWEGLQRLQLRYDVDLVQPTTDFLMSASNLRAAYKELQEKIANEEYTMKTEQELSKALRAINE